jgi:capsular polysaccharide export protein
LARNLATLTGRQVLLLQSPIGPFFRRLAEDLTANGNTVSKVNFNGGDWYYFRGGENFRGDITELSDYLREIIQTRQIDLVLMFSDCRPIHTISCAVTRELGIEFGVFEEGYIRPNHVTFERSGVNAYSQTDFLAENSDSDIEAAYTYKTVDRDLKNKMRYAFLYFLFGILGRIIFRKYKHHKAFIPRQLIWWVRSGIRKILYRRKDRKFMSRLEAGEFETYFLVALQVYDDFQVVTHSDYDDVRDFITEVVTSFMRHAPPKSHLVIKHHPMDRGYRNYAALIADLVGGTATENFVHYQHDIDLIPVLEGANGTVIINSTVGLESISRGCPTCVTGRSFYQIPGLVFEGQLDEFWTSAHTAVPDPEAVKRLRDNILCKTQINGSFYTPFSDVSSGDVHFGGMIFKEPKT